MTVTIVVIIVKAAVFLIIHTADFNSLEILIAGYWIYYVAVSDIPVFRIILVLVFRLWIETETKQVQYKQKTGSQTNSNPKWHRL